MSPLVVLNAKCPSGRDIFDAIHSCNCGASLHVCGGCGEQWGRVA